MRILQELKTCRKLDYTLCDFVRKYRLFIYFFSVSGLYYEYDAADLNIIFKNHI